MGTLDAPAQRLTGPLFRNLSEGILGLSVVGSCTTPRAISDGTQTAASYQLRMFTKVACRGLRFAYTNYVNNGSETRGANAYTVKATANIGGTLVPLTFGGVPTATVNPSQIVLSDPLDIDLPAGTTIYVVSYVTVTTSGMTWPFPKYGMGNQNEGSHNASDDTGIAFPSGSYANNWTFGPTALLGVPSAVEPRRNVRLALVGDSILRGATANDDTLGLNILAPISATPSSNIAAYGETASAFAATTGHRHRTPFIEGSTAALVGYGANDVKAGTPTLAAVQTALIGVWQILQARGIPAWQWTITPNTSSTDNWATTANQTVSAAPYSNAVRTGVNDWIRDGAPMLNGSPVAVGSSANGTLRAGQTGHLLRGYHEVADSVESARNSGIWKASGTAKDYTTDGIHPGPAGYAAMAAAINWAAMGVV